MKHRENVKIIAFVGLPGAGSSSAVEHLKSEKYPSVHFGGIILGAMDDAGLEHTAENEQMFREELRQREGKDFIVNRIVSQLHNLIEAGQRRIVADGLYTWTEYKTLKREFPGELTVVAVVAPKRLRHHRLMARPTRSLTEFESNQRDRAEIENLEKGGPIAIADHYIINDGTLEKLYENIDSLLQDINFR